MTVSGPSVHKNSVNSMLVDSLNRQESAGTLQPCALQSFVATSDMSHGVEQRAQSTQNRRLLGHHVSVPSAAAPRQTGHWPGGVLWFSGGPSASSFLCAAVELKHSEVIAEQRLGLESFVLTAEKLRSSVATAAGTTRHDCNSQQTSPSNNKPVTTAIIRPLHAGASQSQQVQ